MRSATAPLLFLLLTFVVLSRPIFWTAHPPNFDFANFALGVDRFDPREHQPHPPGYPLVILTARVFAAAGLSSVRALYATSLLGSIAAVLGAFFLGKRLAGEPGGLLAGLLLAAEPVFWRSGVSSPARVFLAAGVCWLLCGCLALAEGRRRWLWITPLLLAFAAGFRPELLLLFAAPCWLAARMGGAGGSRVAVAAALSLALSAPWVAWMAAAFGSAGELLYTYYHYFLHHASTTSALFGAHAAAWKGMLWNSLAWNSLPAVVALVSVLLCRAGATIDRRFFALAAAYLLPALAIQLAVHEGADTPDHSLGTIAVLCVAGGSALGTCARASLRRAAVAAAALAAMLCFSFAAPGKLPPRLDLLSLRSFAKSQQQLAETLGGLRSLLRSGDALLVLNDSPLSWRILEYEFPQVVTLGLDATLQENSTEFPGGWQFLGWRRKALSETGIALPAAQRLQIFSSPAGPQRKLVLERLCSQLPCQASGARLEAAVGRWQGTLALPPYTLQLGLSRPPGADR